MTVRSSHNRRPEKQLRQFASTTGIVFFADFDLSDRFRSRSAAHASLLGISGPSMRLCMRRSIKYRTVGIKNTVVFGIAVPCTAYTLCSWKRTLCLIFCLAEVRHNITTLISPNLQIQNYLRQVTQGKRIVAESYSFEAHRLLYHPEITASFSREKSLAKKSEIRKFWEASCGVRKLLIYYISML